MAEHDDGFASVPAVQRHGHLVGGDRRERDARMTYYHCGQPLGPHYRCMGRMHRHEAYDWTHDGYRWEVYECGSCTRIAYNLHEGHDAFALRVDPHATVRPSTESPSQTNESPTTRTTQPWWQQMAAAVASSAWNRFEAVRPQR